MKLQVLILIVLVAGCFAYPELFKRRRGPGGPSGGRGGQEETKPEGGDGETGGKQGDGEEGDRAGEKGDEGQCEGPSREELERFKEGVRACEDFLKSEGAEGDAPPEAEGELARVVKAFTREVNKQDCEALMEELEKDISDEEKKLDGAPEDGDKPEGGMEPEGEGDSGGPSEGEAITRMLLRALERRILKK